jgi:hypothetical protein
MENKQQITELLRDFYPFAKNKLGFNKPVKVSLHKDVQNSQNPLGKTAFYDPHDMKIGLYYINRHPKDVLRSFAHELMHHKQNCDGRLTAKIGEGPAHQNEDLKKLEIEAQEAGFLVREYEEQLNYGMKSEGRRNRRRIRRIGYMDIDLAKAEGELLEKKKSKKSKKKAKMKQKKNPWAICTSQVGRKNKDKYEKCVLSVKDQYDIKKESIKESKLTKNPDLDRDLSDLEEKNTIKDHYSKRAERVFERLMEKYKSKQESEVKNSDK